MSNIQEAYEKSYNAKNKYPDSFNNWIREFLHFAPQKLLEANFTNFQKIMKSESSSKNISSIKLHKYSATQYIFYYMDIDSPESMTNHLHLAEDAEFWVNFFNIDFFNIENPKNVLYSFVEGLNSVCEESGVNYNDVSKKLFKLFFDLNDFEESQYGPAKSRFGEYYRQKMGHAVGTNPNKTLILSEDFFESFKENPNKKEKLEKILRSDPPPSEEDYKEVIKILELKGKKGKRLWTDDNFSVYRSNNRLYIYLVNETDGKVWKIYSDKTPIKDILSEYKQMM